MRRAGGGEMMQQNTEFDNAVKWLSEAFTIYATNPERARTNINLLRNREDFHGVDRAKVLEACGKSERDIKELRALIEFKLFLNGLGKDPVNFKQELQKAVDKLGKSLSALSFEKTKKGRAEAWKRVDACHDAVFDARALYNKNALNGVKNDVNEDFLRFDALLEKDMLKDMPLDMMQASKILREAFDSVNIIPQRAASYMDVVQNMIDRGLVTKDELLAEAGVSERDFRYFAVDVAVSKAVWEHTEAASGEIAENTLKAHVALEHTGINEMIAKFERETAQAKAKAREPEEPLFAYPHFENITSRPE